MREFRFHAKFDLTLLLGIRAKNVRELLDGITQVPESSIYYHTHRFLQQHHYLSPEPPNDFAYWIAEILNDVVLAEKISSIDIVQFHSIADLRTALTDVLSGHLSTLERMVDCPPGHEFHFTASQIFILPTPYVATTLRGFREALERVSVSSLYYHVFDAKLRLGHDENDFSAWFRDIGQPDLANALKTLDPYTHTMEGLRKRIIILVRSHDKN